MLNQMYKIKGDITTADSGYICQSTNSKGVMNSGVAKAIRGKWPEVFSIYRSVYEKQSNRLFLGQVIPVKVNDNLWVMNIVGQDNYGYDGKMYTSYGAIEVGIKNMIKRIKTEEQFSGTPMKLHTPLIGCGLGGGDWNKMEPLIIDAVNGQMGVTLWTID